MPKEIRALFSASRYLDLGEGTAIGQDAGPPVEGDESKYRSREPANIDAWGDAICSRCPLDECVKPQGCLGVRWLDAERGCPIDIARMKGWDIDTALCNSNALNLLSASL